MNTLQKFNIFKVNLMHILFVGPLIFYIGKGKKNNPEIVYHMILALSIMLPSLSTCHNCAMLFHVDGLG